jgi:hypothetical protein
MTLSAINNLPMKQIFLVSSIIVLTIFASCSKDLENSNGDVIGTWTWKSGYSSGGVQMFSADTTKIYLLQFKNDHSFINQATTVIGGATEGNYEIQHPGNNRIIILKSTYTRPDTLKLSVAANKMTLTSTDNGYSWYYYFDKN